MVFVRIGWMTYYDLGEEPDGPVRGGSFNKDEIGAEANNFSEIRGRLYGFAQVSRRLGGFNLVRLGAAPSAVSVDGTLVAMYATKETGGQRLVGWYRNATCHVKSHRRPSRKYGLFNFEADVSSAVLLPLSERRLPPPSRLDGGFGQSNVRYACSESGDLELHRWMAKALAWIRGYHGPNMLRGAEPGEDPDLESSSRGAGYLQDPARRKAVEDRAMVVAQEFFAKRGYRVDDVHSRRPYDLVCTKGADSFRVEVKGTTDRPMEVELTSGEVHAARARGQRTALFVVSEIHLRPTRDGAFRGHGGKSHWISDWRPHQRHLTPTRYRYVVPRELRLAR